ncbi:RNA polymerase sigma factor [Stigmatella aurantiaca]|nr:sigma-70 family RNA polymerase sigma factor [Stigmatella aurantiaca]
MGDADSFKLLMEKHLKWMVPWTRKYLPEAEAEDAIQDAFITLLHEATKLHPGVTFRSFLFGILQNSVLHSLRSLARHWHEPFDDEEGANDTRVDPSPNPELELLDKGSYQEIAKALFSECSLREQQVILLTLESQDDATIAKALGTTANNVRVVRHRTIVRLRKVLVPPTQEFAGQLAVSLGTDLSETDVQEVESRLKEFEDLEPGWLDGKEGEVPSKEGIAWVRRIILALMASYKVPLPYLYPTPEGGVQAEWSFKPWEVSAEFNLTERSAYLHAVKGWTHETMIAEVSFDAEGKALEESARFIIRIQKRGEYA